MIKVIRYSHEYKSEWNDFLSASKNQTFLFNRNFMDYHKDRFEDYSLMVYDDKENLVCCFPGNRKDEKTIVSHGGLTYGGFVFKEDEKLNTILKVIKELLIYLLKNGIKEVYYKSIPRFYNVVGSDEIEYAMFILEAVMYRRDLALCISMDNKLKYQNRRRRSIKKAIKFDVLIKQESSFDDFWNIILIPNLLERYGVTPVHSLQEINQLAMFFPNNIKQYNAYLNNEIVAGCTIFETPTVAHAQYISASNIGRNSGALDLLFDYLINNIYDDKKYFDFGISNENNGKKINHGLLEWKEGFGGRSFSHDFYKIKTKAYYKLDIVIND